MIGISHSSREGLVLKIERGVEPGIIWVFDCSLRLMSDRQYEVRLLSMQDEVFKIDNV